MNRTGHLRHVAVSALNKSAATVVAGRGRVRTVDGCLSPRRRAVRLPDLKAAIAAIPALDILAAFALAGCATLHPGHGTYAAASYGPVPGEVVYGSNAV